MDLYLISQDVNNDYDTYDSAVVCAHTEDEARRTHPGEGHRVGTWAGVDSRGTWTSMENVTVRLIGVARSDVKPGVVIASFNAG